MSSIPFPENIKGYKEISSYLLEQDFEHIEKDDRLLDIYPKETRAWGVDLWEKWSADKVELIRLKAPYTDFKAAQSFSMKRSDMEQLLRDNKPQKLI